MKNKVLGNTAFVLVRPEFLGNIGSVARVMKNFGFTDLRLVSPPRNYKDAEARIMAVGAFDILKGARVYEDLFSAIEDRQMTVATSSGRRRSRQLDNFSDVAQSIARQARTNSIAIIFGNEKNGLLDTELSLCNKKIRIESSRNFPALNLAQTAGIIAYNLSRAEKSHADQPSQKRITRELPTAAELRELFEQIELLLGSVEFSRTYNKSLIMQEVEDAFNRMTPSKREAAIIKGALIKLNQKLDLFPTRRGTI